MTLHHGASGPVPPVALTMGEPAGIGPEIATKAFGALQGDVPFFLIGDPSHLPGSVAFTPIERPSDALGATTLPVLPHNFASPRVPGEAQPEHAQPVIDVIARAVELTQQGQALAVCTNPINKKALKDGAGFPFPGHTEYLSHLAGDADVVMMLACDELRVVPATIHIALSDVPTQLTREKLTQVIRTTHAALIRDFGHATPRIAVAGLNPHAGEGGTMGMDEIDMITPLLDDLRTEGLDLLGPLPADTMFHASARAGYDAAVCMYHDQALIPIKTIDFAGGVNVTLGLPFVRTSPDHGTAYDIAGSGKADATSLINALRMAHQLGLARRNEDNS
ncbi:4-hydroxythreonine-4-phosphate dehydrogenase [Aliiroseovarius halocynthiae]|uniref:4-hydroxythreonine-4-phosphate dehydrogenase n=1 Tax=Aliiroseovarius halocynthiae TaxID=985055 RepID=A0A545SVJ0_9RHOB|nr:4-hydroxythreonine-4-phosphate dehydrogenase PdxA [Aliiroseovarius halocynthiae]TQV68981.1 4-hydroxythreonine-4-phosphate dehydrogenase PdxA [Aliiroseovarius halocynthiae]SMR71723.1 4-hydroxythreonine-4-phosphate dehydrogenase [Aliiroseovarius halocynthiae]